MNQHNLYSSGCYTLIGDEVSHRADDQIGRKLKFKSCNWNSDSGERYKEEEIQQDRKE